MQVGEEREADWRLTELEDRFRAREHEMQTRHRKRESKGQHADWLRAVEKTALDLLDIKAPGAPPQMWLDLHKAVHERFAPLNPIPADQVTGELIRGTVQPFLGRHREQRKPSRSSSTPGITACRWMPAPSRGTEKSASGR